MTGFFNPYAAEAQPWYVETPRWSPPFPRPVESPYEDGVEVKVRALYADPTTHVCGISELTVRPSVAASDRLVYCVTVMIQTKVDPPGGQDGVE